MAEIKHIEFKWGKKRELGGKKRNVQFYESFTYEGLDYTLYDNVYLHKQGHPFPFLGKLIKIWENPIGKSKRIKVLWYFQPCEISNHLQGVELIHPNEVFLASGQGLGVANVNPLEALGGRCNVVCISKDGRNPQPSDQDIQMADFVFYRTFDVDQCTIMDKMDDKFAGVDVKFIFNRTDSIKTRGGETATETNERVILPNKSNSSENQKFEDRKGEKKPVVGEKLGADKIGSSLEVKENKDLNVDERPHKKVKFESSEKVSNDKNNNDVHMPNCDSGRNDLKPVVPNVITSEDEPRCATNPNGTSKNTSTKLTVGDDELTKPTNELVDETSSRPADDGTVTVDKAMEVTSRPDIVSGVLELTPSFLSFCLALGTWSSTAH